MYSCSLAVGKTKAEWEGLEKLATDRDTSARFLLSSSGVPSASESLSHSLQSAAYGTDRQTDIDRYRQTDKWTERQVDRQISRQVDRLFHSRTHVHMHGPTSVQLVNDHSL